MRELLPRQAGRGIAVCSSFMSMCSIGGAVSPKRRKHTIGTLYSIVNSHIGWKALGSRMESLHMGMVLCGRTQPSSDVDPSSRHS